ncbi:mCG1032866, partial [Mus musculus]
GFEYYIGEKRREEKRREEKRREEKRHCAHCLIPECGGVLCFPIDILKHPSLAPLHRRSSL